LDMEKEIHFYCKINQNQVQHNIQIYCLKIKKKELLLAYHGNILKNYI